MPLQPLQLMLGRLLWGHLLVCDLHLSAITTVNFAMNSAADQLAATKTTHAWPTGIAGNPETASEANDDNQLRGYRKRWSERQGGQTGSASEAAWGNGLLDDTGSVVGDAAAKRLKLPTRDDVEVLGKSQDDFAEEQEVSETATTGMDAQNERQAIVNTDMRVFKFPWERGRLARIFGNDPVVAVKTPQLKMGSQNFLRMGINVSEEGKVEAKPVIKIVHAADGRAAFLTVVRSVQDATETESRSDRRKKALHAWWALLSHSLVSSSIGLKVTVEATFDTVLECAIEILDATFAVKSAGTLFRRLYAIQSYEDWCVERLGKHWLPVSEFDVWTYVRHLQSSGAPATKPSSLVEALRFSWYLLGVEGANIAESSLRVKGVASQMRAAKKPWRPSDLLTVLEVKTLHGLLADESQPLGDRVLAGHALHLLYARSRWSDLTLVNGVYMDDQGHFIEVATRSHKGARTAEMKTRLLPIVAPAVGIDGSAWAKTYLEVRRQCNLCLPLEGYGPMMCAPANASATVWTRRALTSEEGSDFLRIVLKAPKTVDRRISTHSLKSTIMSWTSKYGLSEYSRAVLARHTSKAATATAVYSRDLLSPILRELNLVISAICNGSFCPDATRSGMLTPGALPYLGGTPLPYAAAQAAASPLQSKEAQVAEEENAEVASQTSVWSLAARNAEDMQLFGGSEQPSPAMSQVPEIGDDISETTEENSEQSTSGSEDGEESVEPCRDVPDALTDLVINKKSLVVHHVKAPGLLTCGRKLTPTYEKIFSLTGIRCSRCFDV